MVVVGLIFIYSVFQCSELLSPPTAFFSIV